MATATKTKPKPKTKAAPVATVVASEVKPKPSKAKAKPAPKAKAAPAAKATTSKAPATKPVTKAKPVKPAASKATATKATKAPVVVEAVDNREFNIHGFMEGSDSAIIVDALVAGGASRKEAIEAATAEITDANGIETRSGGVKSVPSLTSSLIKRLIERGYTIEEQWRIVPPADVQEALKKEEQAEKRRAARASKKK